MPGIPLPETAVARLLAHGVPEPELRAMRIVTGAPGRWLPPLFRATAMTFGRYVLVRSAGYDPATSRGLALIAHEAGHVTQWWKLGVIRFLASYAGGLVTSRFTHARHPMERPLNELQRELRRTLEDESA